MLQWLRFCVTAVALFAIAVPPCIAEDLPANIADIALPAGRESRNFFYVKAIDGRPIDNLSNYEWGAADAVNGSPHGTSPVADRYISPERHTVTIAVREVSMSPIRLFRLFGNGEELSGDVTFTALSGHQYRVAGDMNAAHPSIWIMDLADGNPVGNKVENNR